MIAVDLPGFGETPPLNGEVSIATLTDSVGEFIREQGLEGVATVGQSMGGRMVLELARRGIGGDTVAKSRMPSCTGSSGAVTFPNGTPRMRRSNSYWTTRTTP